MKAGLPERTTGYELYRANWKININVKCCFYVVNYVARLMLFPGFAHTDILWRVCNTVCTLSLHLCSLACNRVYVIFYTSMHCPFLQTCYYFICAVPVCTIPDNLTHLLSGVCYIFCLLLGLPLSVTVIPLGVFIYSSIQIYLHP